MILGIPDLNSGESEMKLRMKQMSDLNFDYCQLIPGHEMMAWSVQSCWDSPGIVKKTMAEVAKIDYWDETDYWGGGDFADVAADADVVAVVRPDAVAGNSWLSKRMLEDSSGPSGFLESRRRALWREEEEEDRIVRIKRSEWVHILMITLKNSFGMIMFRILQIPSSCCCFFVAVVAPEERSERPTDRLNDS